MQGAFGLLVFTFLLFGIIIGGIHLGKKLRHHIDEPKNEKSHDLNM